MNVTPLKNPDYRKLLTANLVNRFGDSVDAIAFTWLTYEITENASLSALVFAANMLPMVIVQPLAAPVVDKMKKKWIMVYADLLRGLLLSVFLFLLWKQLAAPWMFVFFTFATNFVEAFRVPAGVSFVTKVLRKDELDSGINMNQMVSQVCTIGGTAVGGILVAVSPFLAMSLDVISFFISALCIAGIHVQEQIQQTIQQNTYWQNLIGGFQYLGKNKKFLVFVIAALLCNALNSVLSSVSAAYISRDLHGDAIYMSAADILLTITGLATMFFLSKYQDKIRPSILFTWVEFGASAGLYLILGFLPLCPAFLRFGIWTGSFLLYGIFSGIFGAFIQVMFVKVVDNAYLSRASGVFNSLGTLCTPIFSIGMAVLVKRIEIPVIFLCTSLLCVLVLLLLSFSGCCKVLDMEESS